VFLEDSTLVQYRNMLELHFNIQMHLTAVHLVGTIHCTHWSRTKVWCICVQGIQVEGISFPSFTGPDALQKTNPQNWLQG